MLFRRQIEPTCKVRVAEECTDAGDDFSEVYVERFPTKTDLFALESWSSWQLFINEAVQLPNVAK
jgi:hypothetical protein